MLYPSIDKLLNIVDSKYKLVHIASRRAKQMMETKHYQMSEAEYKSKWTRKSTRRIRTWANQSSWLVFFSKTERGFIWKKLY